MHNLDNENKSCQNESLKQRLVTLKERRMSKRSSDETVNTCLLISVLILSPDFIHSSN